MTGSTQFNATIDSLVRKGFTVARLTPAQDGEGPVCYMTWKRKSRTLLAQVEQVSDHDILVNGETLSEFIDWFEDAKAN